MISPKKRIISSVDEKDFVIHSDGKDRNEKMDLRHLKGLQYFVSPRDQLAISEREKSIVIPKVLSWGPSIN